MQARLAGVLAASVLVGGASAYADSAPKPAVTIDLKAAGLAADMFSDPPEGRDEARSLLNFFWLGPDRLAAAFSTSPRYTKPNHPVPFQVRLIVFDTDGKQQAAKEWTYGTGGPEGDAALDIEPGPDNTILVIHQSASEATGLAEGNQVQVLGPDTKLMQNFYIPASSVLVPLGLPSSSLVLRQYLRGGQTVLQFFSGHPLKSRFNIPLAGKAETLVGPEEAARLLCSGPGVCPEVRVIKVTGPAWGSVETDHVTPHPRAFLNADTLLVEEEVPEKPNKLLLLRANGARSELPPLKNNLKPASIAGVAAGGSRFAIEAYGESDLCGLFDFACAHRAKAMVIDSSEAGAGKVVFEAGLSPEGGQSALAPDGKRLAVLDRSRILIYALP